MYRASPATVSKIPVVLKPVNLILVRPKIAKWTESFGDPAVFPRFIAAGFDLLHCCIAIRVSDNLHFDTLEVEDGAYESARHSNLPLSEAGFETDT